MAYNEVLTSRVREVLMHIPDVEEKKMFRGVAFMVNGKLCLSVGDNELMLRIDPILHEAYVRKNGCRTMIMKGREYKGYVYVAADSIKTKRELEDWINLALTYNPKAKAAKKEARTINNFNCIMTIYRAEPAFIKL